MIQCWDYLRKPKTVEEMRAEIESSEIVEPLNEFDEKTIAKVLEAIGLGSTDGRTNEYSSHRDGPGAFTS